MPAGERDAGAGERRGARADGRVVAAGRAMHDEALVTDAHVCFTCDNGLLYTLDRATGREVWRHDLGDPQVARVLLHTVRPSAGTR